MYIRKTAVNLNCGLDLVAEVLGGKWKTRLLYFIAQGTLRPGELHRRIPGATLRVVLLQLKELEKHELVYKTIYAEMPPRVEYQLSALGRSLVPLVDTLGQWGDEHAPQLRQAIERQLSEITDVPPPAPLPR